MAKIKKEFLLKVQLNRIPIPTLWLVEAFYCTFKEPHSLPKFQLSSPIVSPFVYLFILMPKPGNLETAEYMLSKSS